MKRIFVIVHHRDTEDTEYFLLCDVIRCCFLYINETATVIYRSKMTHGNNNKKNFEVYTAEEFIAAHSISPRNHSCLPQAGQMVRYYGWYSNPPAERAGKSRGIRKKQGTERSSDEPVAKPDKDIEIIAVSDYQLLPLHLPATGTACLPQARSA